MGVRELFELKGKVALVTGGSRGLGLQIAQALGEMGARIAISRTQARRTRGSQVAACETGYRCSDRGQRSDQAGSSAGAGRGGRRSLRRDQHPGQQRGHELGRAGGAVPHRRLEQGHDLELHQRVHAEPGGRESLLHTATFGQHHRRGFRRGTAVGMTMKAAAYYASKAAALHLTRVLAAEWGPHGIRVNAICPGFFPSKMSSGLLDKISASVIERTPLGRIGGDTDLMGCGGLPCVGRVAPRDGPVHCRRRRRVECMNRAVRPIVSVRPSIVRRPVIAGRRVVPGRPIFRVAA